MMGSKLGKDKEEREDRAPTEGREEEKEEKEETTSYLVGTEFTGDEDTEFLECLKASGIKVTDRFASKSSHRYVMVLSPKQAIEVRNMPKVKEIRLPRVYRLA